ncbi:MAG: M20/M25/M40 family metallo-hydrolase [Spirochaetales bacterium]|nr:M20/M25/M40 family metallo-hydrolase [Spirochaetales bacterium]
MSHLEDVDRWIQQHREEILSTISELVQIRTENLPPGGNEKPGQEYLFDRVTRFAAAADVDLFEVDDVPGIREHPLFFPTIDGQERVYKDRPILVARRPGKGGGRDGRRGGGPGDGPSLVFTGHMDTMPTYGKTWEVFPDPYSGQIKDGRLYGRGSMDMKAGTASGFLALQCLHDLGVELRGDVYAESVIDEENGGVNGTIAARLRNPDIDFAILSEPSDLVVGIESIGGSDWKVVAEEQGPGGIGPDVELPNPIYKLSRIALALEKFDRKLAEAAVPDTYDPGMRIRLLTYQLASGGASYLDSGAVPTGGHLIFWQEIFSYTNEEQARRELLEFMQAELGGDPAFAEGLPSFQTVIRFLEGHRTDPGHPALESIRRAYEQAGVPHRAKGIPFATDAFCFRKASQTDVAIIGPSGKNPHGVDEYVEIESVLSLIRIMVLTALDYCG